MHCKYTLKCADIYDLHVKCALKGIANTCEVACMRLVSCTHELDKLNV
ncbi:hypothetical protein HMPREF3230_00124 [Gardnerella vaginalis]|uniref:Uncharacterized protein n=1 Tax=Gardnerella vaginalis TaxID=2702 RepID=A0A135ZBG7_GARVA|nr:hypothetical protein HMPREF3230_00124 [Gardnerella vaginalis]